MSFKVSLLDCVFILSLFILLFIYKFLFIIGDEPDFVRRTVWYLDALKNHKYLFPFADNIDITRNCFQDNFYGPMKSNSNDLRFSTWFSFDPDLCNYNFHQILYRYFINILVSSPIILIFFFRKYLLNIFDSSNTESLNNRINILASAIIYPTILYYIGNFSHEQLANIFVLLFFVFFYNLILCTMISLITFFLLDYGTGLVLILFLVFNRLFLLALNYINLKSLIIFLIFLVIIISYIGEYIFLTMSNNIVTLNIPIISDKFNSLLNEYYKAQDMGLRQKYNIFLRPIFVFYGLMFLTPSQIKSIFLILFTIISIFYSLYVLLKKIKSINLKSIDSLNFYSLMFFVLIIVFILPTHSNAKYFIFIIPFSMMFVHQFIPFYSIFIFSLISSIILIVNYSLYVLY